MHKTQQQQKQETRAKNRDKKRATKMKVSGRGMKRFGTVPKGK
jgi:hypothetical protein